MILFYIYELRVVTGHQRYEQMITNMDIYLCFYNKISQINLFEGEF